jgi:hypothetical protein
MGTGDTDVATYLHGPDTCQLLPLSPLRGKWGLQVEIGAEPALLLPSHFVNDIYMSVDMSARIYKVCWRGVAAGHLVNNVYMSVDMAAHVCKVWQVEFGTSVVMVGWC